MKIFSKTVFILSFIFINLCLTPCAHAISDVKISLVPDKLSTVTGEEINLSVMFSCEEDINISAFRMCISFDKSKFIYKNIYSKDSSSDFKTYENNNTLTIVYLTSERGIDIPKNSSTCLFELNFKTTSDSSIGTSAFSASADGLCNYDCTEIPCAYIEPITISKVEGEPANCNLSSLSAPGCILAPQFSPDITNYIINVAYSKSSIEFTATPEDPEASVSVSRKTLNAAGKSTNINITVKSPDSNSKKVYTVTVNRGVKDSSSSSESSKSSKSSKSNKSSKSSSSSESSAANKSTNPLSENLSASDSQNESTLVVKENNFNFPLFFAVSAVVVSILILLLKKNKKN